MDEYCIYDARAHCQKPELCDRIAELEAALAPTVLLKLRHAGRDQADAQWREVISQPIAMHENEPLADAIWRLVREKRDGGD